MIIFSLLIFYNKNPACKNLYILLKLNNYMFLMHYLLPLVIFYFYRNKAMLWGLLLGNLIDLDHIYYRIIGKVPWFESACSHLGAQCSIGFYPLHNIYVGIFCLIFSGLVLFKDKRIKFIGLMFLGAFLNLLLDYIHLITGVGI